MGEVYTQRLDRRRGKADEYVLPPCTQVNPDIFIQHRTRTKAKQICMTCPKALRKDCLVWALKRPDGDPGGVYGGLSAEDREDLRKRISPPS